MGKVFHIEDSGFFNVCIKAIGSSAELPLMSGNELIRAGQIGQFSLKNLMQLFWRIVGFVAKISGTAAFRVPIGGGEYLDAELGFGQTEQSVPLFNSFVGSEEEIVCIVDIGFGVGTYALWQSQEQAVSIYTGFESPSATAQFVFALQNFRDNESGISQFLFSKSPIDTPESEYFSLFNIVPTFGSDVGNIGTIDFQNTGSPVGTLRIFGAQGALIFTCPLYISDLPEGSIDITGGITIDLIAGEFWSYGGTWNTQTGAPL